MEVEILYCCIFSVVSCISSSLSGLHPNQSMKPRGLTIGKAVVLPGRNFLLRVVKNKASLLFCFCAVFILCSALFPLAAGILLIGVFKDLFFLKESREEKDCLFSTWQKETKFLQVNLRKGNNSYLLDSSTHANIRGSEAWSITFRVNWDFSFRESHSWLKKTTRFKMPK